MSDYFEFPEVEMSEELGPAALSSALQDIDAFLRRPGGRILIQGLRAKEQEAQEQINEDGRISGEAAQDKVKNLIGQWDVISTLLQPRFGLDVSISAALRAHQQDQGGAVGDERGNP